mgnify:FL=1
MTEKEKFWFEIRKAEVACRAASEGILRAMGKCLDLPDLEPEQKRALIQEAYWDYQIEDWHLWFLFKVTSGECDAAIASRTFFVKCFLCAGHAPASFRSHEERSRDEQHRFLCGVCGAEDEERRAQRVDRLKSMPYDDYLQSDEWRARREQIVARDGHACRVCGSNGQLHVHHRSYERRGDEADADLITLCAKCHELFHQNGKLVRIEG